METKALSLYEIDLLVELVKTKSIRELARRQGVTAGQISKALRKLEQKAKARLVERSVHGVVLTHEGLRVLPVFRDILARAEALSEGTKTSASVLAIGSTSFLVNHLLVPALGDSELPDGLRLRFLEISPDQFTNAGLRNAFEIAFHFGKQAWPGTWHQEKVADVGWSLCCGTKHPLASKGSLTEREVLKWKFVMPSYWTQEGFALGNDGCPVPPNKRLRGHETSTAEGAMALVRATDQIAYLPNILVRSYEETGEVKRLDVKGWGEIRPLYLAVRSDLVSEKQLRLILSAVKLKI